MKRLKNAILLMLCVFAFAGIFSLIVHQRKSHLAEVVQVIEEESGNKEAFPMIALDIMALNTAMSLGGGVYYNKIGGIVPFFSDLVSQEWENYKNSIYKRIGPIEHNATKASTHWHNSAQSIEALVEDAQIASHYFKEMCLAIARRTQTEASFGINNQHMLKSELSIKRKVVESKRAGLSEAEAVRGVRDALRSTIIADEPEQIQSIIKSLQQVAYNIGREVEFINIWEENRSSGYVGIHAKMLFPVHHPDGITPSRNIIVEIQIHLRCIMDGTSTSVKERIPNLYDARIPKGISPDIQNASSKLLYLAAMTQCVKRNSLITKPIHKTGKTIFNANIQGHAFSENLHSLVFQRMLQPPIELWALSNEQPGRHE